MRRVAVLDNIFKDGRGVMERAERPEVYSVKDKGEKLVKLQMKPNWVGQSYVFIEGSHIRTKGYLALLCLCFFRGSVITYEDIAEEMTPFKTPFLRDLCF